MPSGTPPESREIAHNIVMALLYKNPVADAELQAEKVLHAFARIFLAIKASKTRSDYHVWMSDLTIGIISTCKSSGDLDKETEKAIKIFEIMGNAIENPSAHK